MRQSRGSGRRNAASGLIVALVATVTALVGGSGTAHAFSDSQAQTSESPRPLAFKRLGVSCECGGAGYLWGWHVVASQFTGARDGHHYIFAVKGGTRVDAVAYGRTGSAQISQTQAGFEPGNLYRFRIIELKRREVTRTSPWRSYRIPTPVEHPTQAHIDTETRDGREVMVAGQTYHTTFDGSWGDDVVFASGVDRYYGNDRFGWYQEEGYPLPWSSRSDEPIVELTPPEDFVGTTWNLLVVGYRVAAENDPFTWTRAGEPVPGSEWGFWFPVDVVAPTPTGRPQDHSRAHPTPSRRSSGAARP